MIAAARDLSQGPDYRFAKTVYRWRWLSSLVVVVAVIYIFISGMENVGGITESVMNTDDISDGSGTIAPQMFDPSLDVWFDTGDATVKAYFDIEKQFIAEDYVLVTFENTEDEFGVFSPESLTAIQRLTEQFLTVPGVRHVRSLTYSPWIRWGEVAAGDGAEKGLLFSDLVAQPPGDLTEDDLVERMVAVLGARRAADKIGELRVRRFLGDDADFDQFQGEALLLDSIVDQAATTTAIQIQIIRPNVEGFSDNSALVDKLYSVQYQRSALRGIEHFLNIESGLSVKTRAYRDMENWVSSLPAGAEKSRLSHSLLDPTKNFIKNRQGETIKKYHVYRQSGDGDYVDVADLSAGISTPAGFSPSPLSPYTFRLGGVPVLERNFEIVGSADAKFLPLMFLVIIVALALLSRSLAGVFIPMVVVFASIFGTVGSLFFTGTLFNNLTAMMPNMITAIGVADSIHLVSAWLLMRGYIDDKAELIIEVIRKNALPVLLTTITTAVGFCSLVLNDLTPVKQLGWSMAAGTIIAYLLTMTLVPLLLSLFPHQNMRKSGRGGLWSKSLSEAWASLIVRRRIPVVFCSCLIVLLSCIGLLFVKVDADQRRMFKQENPVLLDLIWIEDHLGGTGDLEIIFSSIGDREDRVGLTEEEAKALEVLKARRIAVSGGVEGIRPLTGEELSHLDALQIRYDAWDKTRIGVLPEFLQLVERFEHRLREEMAKPDSELSIITDLTSPLDILRKIHQVQNGDNPEFYRVVNESDIPGLSKQASIKFDEFSEEYSYTPPQTAATLAAQYYLQYENGARPGESLTAQLSPDRRHFRMQGRGLLCTTQEKQAAIEKINRIAHNEFPALVAGSSSPEPLASLSISGKKTLMDRTGVIVAESFLKSISVALVVILIVIGVFFRSWKLGLVSALPNVLPIVIPLGIFGWLDIMIDGPAIVVAAVALGVCVDDTIHFFTKYTRAINAGSSTEQALAQTFRECGDALTLTTVVLIVGFSTLLMSSFSPNYLMGILAVSMIALAWFADFIVTPAALALMNAESSSNLVAAANSPFGRHVGDVAAP
ncbi:MMPL family transporter [Exilibacterium tricleocarpae]|uniref:MMPL family transporter n=1 Tax=Exilibacterium tricleocarpae TaxID=2591008 RepID=A0A545ST53_9GAMM|nr:MMPL family transporter [Exilibacterium tricleocarpae]TQV68141.1 MMPL family transporter [Exilibacterium tricleocarpae]